MQSTVPYVARFNRNINALFQDALRISLRRPAWLPFLYHALRRQQRAARIRLDWERRGVHVPPFMIASITKRCNLTCKGCYARAQHRAAEPELEADDLRRIIAEARDLGVSLVLIAGGEPLTRPELLDITCAFPEIIFPLFTNGTLLDDALIARLKAQRHVIPVISLEGQELATDQRRGLGVYAHVRDAMHKLDQAGIFFGTSLTLTSRNFDLVTSPAYLEELLTTGCRLFFLVDYVPVQAGTEELALTEAQRQAAPAVFEALRAKLPGLFVAFPGDETLYGGCLAAGRGFVHLSPEGRLEPCPFAPFSDVSLKDMSLRQALQSRFLKTIRESEAHLGETTGGCALWQRRDWVASLLQPSK
jgi:MoaA/NifB/PqqE/SkfB family radical SAM enzyme